MSHGAKALPYINLDHVVSSDDVYGGVSRLFNTVLKRHGFSFTFADSSRPEEVAQAIRENTRLIWIETPTNPLLRVSDIRARAGAVRLADPTGRPRTESTVSAICGIHH